MCVGKQAESGGGRSAGVCAQAGAAAEHVGRESAGTGEEHSRKHLYRAQCLGGAGEPGSAAGDGTDINAGTGTGTAVQHAVYTHSVFNRGIKLV